MKVVSMSDDKVCVIRSPELTEYTINPLTSALPLLPLDPDPLVWQEMRLRGIGASEMAVVLGRSSFLSPFALYHAKLGGYEIPSNEDMEIGLRSEPIIDGMFRDEFPDLYVDMPAAGLWRHPIHEWALCTPDRIAVDPSTSEFFPVELKTNESTAGWGKPGTDEIPDAYYVQVQMQMMILGAERAYVARLGRKTKGHRFAVYVVEYDDAECVSYVDAGYRWMERLAARIEPEIDEHRTTTKALESVYSNVEADSVQVISDDAREEWQRARDAFNAAKKAKDLADNKLRSTLGSAQYGIDMDGHAFVKRSQYKRDGYCVDPHMVDELRRQGGQRGTSGRLQETERKADGQAAAEAEEEGQAR
jgi:putative phage-type endonuclease